MRQRPIVGSEKEEKVLGMGMWTPWQSSEKTVPIRQIENDQVEDKLDDVSETGSGALECLI